jgi:tRNA threonylcarbamoyladenosine biosynthesis protein TsaB
LIVETSGRIGQVALAEGDFVIAARHLDESRRHGRDLVPQVAGLLAGQNWTPKEIDVVLVDVGPGSYTGLRVGIMSAKTFAYATRCALIGIPAFAAIAAQTPRHVTAVDVICDAQQDKIYMQSFRREAATGEITDSSSLAIVSLSGWLVDRDRGKWLTGPGLRVHQTRLDKECRCVSDEYWDPQPQTLLALGRSRYQTGQRDDFRHIEPIYLRPSSAEEKLKEKS